MLGWELPPHNSGGLGVACYHMSKALAAEGADIDFVLPYTAEHPGNEHMTIFGATVTKAIERDGSTYAYANGYEEFNPMGKTQNKYIEFVEQHVKEHPPEVIHAHDWLTMRAGIRAKEVADVPLVIHVHATEFDRSGENFGNPLIHEIEAQALLLADRIFAVSAITKSIIVKNYGIPADKVEVAYNALDPTHLQGYDYDRRTYKHLECLKDEGYTIVSTVGRYTVQKGMTHFLKGAARACEKYDKLAFVFAGDGEQRDELIEMSADLGISDKVYFTGFVRGKQWRDVYNVSDIFVMSSVSEPFGLTALEAAHHNTGLIITKQSGVGEILNSIFRYDFWDIESLADQIVGIATSPALKQSLKDDVMKEYLRISWSDTAKQCMKTYKQLKRGELAL